MSKQTYKVLVADDDESIRESLCKLLLTEGYQVAGVANGTETVEAFRRDQNQIDLLFVDLNMPQKNGWATLDRLLEVNPLLPVLIVTGQPNQHEMAEAAGVSALVEKPIDVPALLRVIHKLLTGPVEPRVRSGGRRGFPFQLVPAAGYAQRYAQPAQNVTPYQHGGLNE